MSIYVFPEVKRHPFIIFNWLLLIPWIMRTLRTIRLIWTFYKGFLFASLILTAVCLYYFWLYGFTVFFEVFWLKTVSLAVTGYFINVYKAKEYYYYQNAGISKSILWLSIICFDLFLFLLLIIVENKLR